LSLSGSDGHTVAPYESDITTVMNQSHQEGLILIVPACYTMAQSIEVTAFPINQMAAHRRKKK